MRKLGSRVDLRGPETRQHHGESAVGSYGELFRVTAFAGNLPGCRDWIGQVLAFQVEAYWFAACAFQLGTLMYRYGVRVERSATEFSDQGAIQQVLSVFGKKVINIDGVAFCVAPDAVCALDLSSQCRELLERGFLRLRIRLIKNQSAKPVMAGAAACRINAAKTDDHRKLCHDMPSRGCNGNAYYIGQTAVYIMAK